jgi:hypothetical protein
VKPFKAIAAMSLNRVIGVGGGLAFERPAGNVSIV